MVSTGITVAFMFAVVGNLVWIGLELKGIKDQLEVEPKGRHNRCNQLYCLWLYEREVFA